MFNKFRSSFTEFSEVSNALIEMRQIPFKYSELLLECGGKTYDNGLYTIHSFEDSNKWSNLLSGYYEKSEEKIIS